MFSSFGWPEALIILSVILIVFGVGKLPQVGGALGKGIREFRRGKAGLFDDIEDGEEPRQLETNGITKRNPRKLSEGKVKV